MKDAFGVDRDNISKAGNAAKWAARATGIPKGGFNSTNLAQRQVIGGRASQAMFGAGKPGTKSSFMSPSARKQAGQASKKNRLSDLRNIQSGTTMSPKDAKATYGRDMIGNGGSGRAYGLNAAADARKSGDIKGAFRQVRGARLQNKPRLP